MLLNFWHKQIKEKWKAGQKSKKQTDVWFHNLIVGEMWGMVDLWLFSSVFVSPFDNCESKENKSSKHFTLLKNSKRSKHVPLIEENKKVCIWLPLPPCIRVMVEYWLLLPQTKKHSFSNKNIRYNSHIHKCFFQHQCKFYEPNSRMIHISITFRYLHRILHTRTYILTDYVFIPVCIIVWFFIRVISVFVKDCLPYFGNVSLFTFLINVA